MTNNSSIEPALVSSAAIDLYAPGFVPAIVAVQLIIIVVGTAGNSLVCLAVVLNSRLRRSVTNYFLVSLAVADILTATLHMTFEVEVWLKNFLWSYNAVACDFYVTMYLVAAPSSILSLLAVSVDRYLSLSRPLHYKYGMLMTRKRALIIIASLWMYSFVTALLPVMGWKPLPKSVVHGYCLYNLTKAYLLSNSAINFFLPVLIMCIIYCKIYRIASAANLRKYIRPRLPSNSSSNLSGEESQFKSCKAASTSFSELRSPTQKGDESQTSESLSESGTELQTVQANSTTEGTAKRLDTSSAEKPKRCPLFPVKMKSIVPENAEECRHGSLVTPCTSERKQSNSKLRGRPNARLNEHRSFTRKNMKAVQTVALIMSCFLLCWMPHTIVSFVQEICGQKCFKGVGPELSPILLLLVYANCCVNPFLYGFQRRDFRNAFKKILQFRRCGRY